MQWSASAWLSWPCWAQPPGAPRDAIFTAWKSYGLSRTSGSWPHNPFLHWSAAKPADSKGQAVEVAGVSWKSSRRSVWGTWKKILYIFSASHFVYKREINVQLSGEIQYIYSCRSMDTRVIAEVKSWVRAHLTNVCTLHSYSWARSLGYQR